MPNKLRPVEPCESDIISVVPLQGGYTSETTLLTCANNKKTVQKCLSNAPKDFFQQEANGLHLLESASPFKTPTVLTFSENEIFMDYIPKKQPTKKDWYQFGEQLAQLHRVTNNQYGFSSDNYFATLPQDNHWQSSWGTFFIEQRLRPYLVHPLLSKKETQQLEKISVQAENIIDNTDPANLIHGDCWYENILFTGDDIYLIDPACYYASREIEMAYLEFTGTGTESLFAAYHGNYPLSPEYQERKKVYQLHAYLTHLHLYGKNYLAGIRSILQHFN